MKREMKKQCELEYTCNGTQTPGSGDEITLMKVIPVRMM